MILLLGTYHVGQPALAARRQKSVSSKYMKYPSSSSPTWSKTSLRIIMLAPETHSTGAGCSGGGEATTCFSSIFETTPRRIEPSSSLRTVWKRNALLRTVPSGFTARPPEIGRASCRERVEVSREWGGCGEDRGE